LGRLLGGIVGASVTLGQGRERGMWGLVAGIRSRVDLMRVAWAVDGSE